eukprot:6193073-Pleurochrysis_carterae.AAC.1
MPRMEQLLSLRVQLRNMFRSLAAKTLLLAHHQLEFEHCLSAGSLSAVRSSASMQESQNKALDTRRRQTF